MAPKKAKIASSSQQAPRVDDPPEEVARDTWDPHKFETPEIQNQCDNEIVPRSYVQEREFPPHNSELFYQPLINVHHFGKLAEERDDFYLPLVREYYAHASAKNSLRCIVRQKWVNINLNVIRAFFQLPLVDNCRFKYLSQHVDEVDWDAVVSLLTLQGRNLWVVKNGVRKKIKRENMNREARFWLHFLLSNVVPMSHYSDLSVDRALLIYLLMQREPVDIAPSCSST